MFEIYICFLISITFHEFAHIIIAKIYKMNLKNLRVSIFGASLEIERKTEKSKLIKIIMYFAGPFSNLMLGIIIYFLKLSEMVKLKIIYTNISLFLFNLLPIVPLDGGNILKEILKYKFSNLKANKINLCISKICLGILSFIYSILIIKIKNIFLLFLIVYLWKLNFIEERKIELLSRAYKTMERNLKQSLAKELKLW